MVFARVHDSRIAGNADFGPGWRLSLAEELLVDGDAATYVDESGARHTFAWTGTAWTASPPTPRHAAATLDFADVDGIRIAVLADGDAVRTFEQADAAGARYVVRLVRTPARELVFDYDGGRLAAVSHDGATLFEVERDRDGRIAAVRDDHGRSVRYAYDADGRLETVRDLAGSDWHYRYRDDGLLGGAVDPEGRTYLAADHDAAGRVARAFADGRLHDYAYATEGTTITEATGQVHALTRNAAGVTTALSSTTGDSWSLTLDAANRVSTLTLPARTIGYAYGGHGRVATMTVADSVSGTTRMHSYDYDAQGRLVAVSGGGADTTVVYAAGTVRIDRGGEVFEYEIDDRGRVASVRQRADPEIRVERDGAGDVVEISQGYRSVRFGRDALGRIVDATYGNAQTSRYFYDDLGNRRLTEHGDGRTVVYSHDAAGNLEAVETTGRDGTVRHWTATGGTAGLVPHVGGSTVDAGYDAVVRKAGFNTGEETIGRANQDSALPSGWRASFSGPSGRPHAAQAKQSSWDTRLAVLMWRPAANIKPDYGVVTFGEQLQANDGGSLKALVKHLRDALTVLESATSLFNGSAIGFDGSANPVFHPTEYIPPVAATATGGQATSCEYVAPDVVDGTVAATAHYYQGNGQTVGLGPDSQASIRQSNRQQLAERRLRDGTSEDPNRGRYGVDSSMVYIGDTVVTYETSCNDSTCTTTFHGAVDDGYWDVNILVPESQHDGPGPIAELPGGTPYAFRTFTWQITYPDPAEDDESQ